MVVELLNFDSVEPNEWSIRFDSSLHITMQLSKNKLKVSSNGCQFCLVCMGTFHKKIPEWYSVTKVV